MFSFYLPPATAVRYYKEASLLDVYHTLTSSYAADATRTLRTISDDKQRAAYKRTHFAYCTFSGTFQQSRKNDMLIQHSGLICLDFDHLDDQLNDTRQILLRDPFFDTQLLFTSPSGNGLKWVVPIDLNLHPHDEWFNFISTYLRKVYNLTPDPACRNVARACFIPHDPNAFIKDTRNTKY